MLGESRRDFNPAVPAAIPLLHRTRTRMPHHLNAAVDAALDGAPLPRPRGFAEAVALAERIRQRAARRLRRRTVTGAALLAARDAFMRDAYRAAAPAGSHTAWCDGTHAATGAALGVLLCDADSRIVARASRTVRAADAFATEIRALETALRLARALHATALTAHTDCAALADLWRRQRGDARLARVRRLAAGFERFVLRAIPRLHNQPAHALARTALSRSTRRDAD